MFPAFILARFKNQISKETENNSKGDRNPALAHQKAENADKRTHNRSSAKFSGLCQKQHERDASQNPQHQRDDDCKNRNVAHHASDEEHHKIDDSEDTDVDEIFCV